LPQEHEVADHVADSKYHLSNLFRFFKRFCRFLVIVFFLFRIFKRFYHTLVTNVINSNVGGAAGSNPAGGIDR
jgi:hypothetical protein